MILTACGIPVLLGPAGSLPREGAAIVATPDTPVGAVLAIADAIRDG